MKTHFRVINRVSRKEQLFNSEEVARFFKLNSIREYAISTIKPTKEKTLDSLAISLVAVSSVILITKLILQCI